VIPCTILYFFLTISCNNPSSFSSFHHHLHKRLRFIFLKSFMARPPFCLGLEALIHFTKWYLFFSPPLLEFFL
jgi:hypothetical protein